MALYELVIVGSIAGQQTINRFNYLSSGSPGTVVPAFGLVYSFGGVDITPLVAGFTPEIGSPIEAWIQAVSLGFSFVQITAFNPYDPTDFYATPFVPPLTGAVGTEALSPASSFALRSTQVRRDIRAGRKAIAGVSEAANTNGGIVATDQLAVLQTLADRCSDILTYDDEGSTLSFQPCIVGREQRDVTDPPDGRTAYYYWEDEADQLLHVAAGITFNAVTTIRTQRSRQYGVGN